MEIINMITFLVGILCLFIGVIIFSIELIGVYRFKYVLNRMHATAIGDTFGIGICLLGLMFLNGLNFTTFKIGLIIVFFWLASPVSSHLISRLEVTTNEDLKEQCELPDDFLKKEEEETVC